jgi:dTDP-4-dehydrorhamnose 3,5-epimerase
VTVEPQPSSIHGARLWPVVMNRDARGHLTEVFRTDWITGIEPAQWIVLVTGGGVLRGMDLHVRHDEFEVLFGDGVLALRDVRRGSPTAGVVEQHRFSRNQLQAVTIPRGVLHGFYFQTESTVFAASTQTYDPTDQLACAWDDPELGIDWPEQPRIVSEQDVEAWPLAALLEEIEPAQPLWPPKVPQ